MKRKARKWVSICSVVVGIGATIVVLSGIGEAKAQDEGVVTRIPVTFKGGFETDRRDEGRPVILIASALGVSATVFRGAFSHVTPARVGEPEPSQVRLNKEALLGALGPYGITNDRLDEVSDYYRYRPERGEMWRHREATAVALVINHKIIGFKITNPGSGYTTVPTVQVPGFDVETPIATVSYSTSFQKNGSITGISLRAPNPPKKGVHSTATNRS